MAEKWGWVVNVISVVVIVLLYLALRNYTAGENLQSVQKFSFILMSLSGLAMIVNNFIRLKSDSGLSSIFFLLVGLGITIYSGVLVYMIFALQNISF